MFALLDEYHLRHDVRLFKTEEEAFEYIKSHYREYGGDITKKFAVVPMGKVYEYTKKVVQIEDGVRELNEAEIIDIRNRADESLDPYFQESPVKEAD